jgi:5'-nucleotidase
VAGGGPTAQVTPQQVVAGQPVQVAGGGFPAGSSLVEQLFSDPVVLGATTADAAGNYRATVTIPLGTTPGTHTLRVSVVGGTATAAATLLVTAPVPAPASPGAGTLSRTGADVAGPARLAFALVVLGAGLVGLTWAGTDLSVPAFGRRRRTTWPRRR